MAETEIFLPAFLISQNSVPKHRILPASPREKPLCLRHFKLQFVFLSAQQQVDSRLKRLGREHTLLVR